MRRVCQLASVCALGALALTACSTDDGNGKHCPPAATFELSLSAVGGPLPPDTAIEVKYGGGIETYQLADSIHEQEAILCDAGGADAGDPSDAADAGEDAGEEPAGPIQRLHCKLWTGGGATLTVTASGYPDLERDLDAVKKDACIQTVPVDVVLGDQDATR